HARQVTGKALAAVITLVGEWVRWFAYEQRNVVDSAVSPTALITGIAGQDGSYLAELLLEKGYQVVGMIPRRSTPETQTLRIDHIRDRLRLEYGDVLDLASI